MITFLAALVLAVPPQEKTPPVDAERVKAAVEEFDKAFKSKEVKDRVAAIERAAQVVDGALVSAIARGLRDRETDVQRSAILALRGMNHPDALQSLQDTARRDKALKKDPALYCELLKGIGQYGSASSIPLLADEAWSVVDHNVIQARILSLGRIRDPAAVEALMSLMKVAGRHKMQAFMEDFRLSLVVLTGVDQGASQDLWQSWWNDHKRKLEIKPEPPELPKGLQQKWSYYWGEGRMYDRPTRSGERGRDDPEGQGRGG